MNKLAQFLFMLVLVLGCESSQEESIIFKDKVYGETVKLELEKSGISFRSESDNVIWYSVSDREIVKTIMDRASKQRVNTFVIQNSLLADFFTSELLKNNISFQRIKKSDGTIHVAVDKRDYTKANVIFVQSIKGEN